MTIAVDLGRKAKKNNHSRGVSNGQCCRGSILNSSTTDHVVVKLLSIYIGIFDRYECEGFVMFFSQFSYEFCIYYRCDCFAQPGGRQRWFQCEPNLQVCHELNLHVSHIPNLVL